MGEVCIKADEISKNSGKICDEKVDNAWILLLLYGVFMLVSQLQSIFVGYKQSQAWAQIQENSGNKSKEQQMEEFKTMQQSGSMMCLSCLGCLLVIAVFVIQAMLLDIWVAVNDSDTIMGKGCEDVLEAGFDDTIGLWPAIQMVAIIFIIGLSLGGFICCCMVCCIPLMGGAMMSSAEM